MTEIDRPICNAAVGSKVRLVERNVTRPGMIEDPGLEGTVRGFTKGCVTVVLDGFEAEKAAFAALPPGELGPEYDPSEADELYIRTWSKWKIEVVT